MRPFQFTATLHTLLLVASTLFWALPALGDPGQGDIWSERHRVNLGLYGGVVFPPRAHELYDEVAWQEPFNVVAPDVGLRMGYMPWPYIGLELEGGVMPTRTREGGDGALLYTVRAHVLGQYPARFSPFLLAGYGLLGVSSDQSAVGSDVDGAFHAGLGLKFHATKRLTVRLDGRIIISGQAGPTGFMPYFEALLGASYMLYWKTVVDEKKDSDGDGVPDVKDRCPSRAAATADGCPPRDSDGDGVPDDKDRCPDKAAKTADGCPVKDSDGDGIPDDKDQCPNKPETRNGYQDDDGCPDTVPAKPRPTPLSRFGGTFADVLFWFNRAALRGEELPRLKKVAEVLKQNPGMRVQLRGHADETGPEDYNRRLSLRRAVTVRWYLMRQGVKAGQLSVKGLGESKGKGAAHRRVEIMVMEK